MPSRRGDFCVLGASGFYGAQTVVALAGLASRYALLAAVGGDSRGRQKGAIADAEPNTADATDADALTIVLAGRDPRKLEAMLPELQRQADEAARGGRNPVRLDVLPLAVDVALEDDDDGHDDNEPSRRSRPLSSLALAAPVLLNCIRPVAYEWSERVMVACARHKTAYLDLCARPAFLDAVREMLFCAGGDEQGDEDTLRSSPPPPPRVPGCGFDYALPDVATVYALRAYAQRHAGKPPRRVRATFLVRTPPPPPSDGDSSGSGGGGFKLRLGAVDELLSPLNSSSSSSHHHRGWDPRRADVRDALARAAERRRSLEARELAAPPPKRAWLLREEDGLAAGPRWTAPFFLGGGVEADLLRANLYGGGEDEHPPLEFDPRVALPPLPSWRTLLLLALAWPLLLSLVLPWLTLLVVGALIARRSPRARRLYLACLPFLSLGLVTADDSVARRSADRSLFERVCVLNGEDDDEEGCRPLRVAFRGSFAQSLTPQCVAAAAVCLLNESEHAAQQQQQPGSTVGRGRPRVLTPAQALLMQPPPPGCPSFLEMLRLRHGLAIEEEEI